MTPVPAAVPPAQVSSERRYRLTLGDLETLSGRGDTLARGDLTFHDGEEIDGRDAGRRDNAHDGFHGADLLPAAEVGEPAWINGGVLAARRRGSEAEQRGDHEQCFGLSPHGAHPSYCLIESPVVTATPERSMRLNPT